MRNPFVPKLLCMMTEMTGCCRLCYRTAEIKWSHLLPSAIYKLMRDDNGPIRNPISVADGIAQTSSKELRAPLLCDACEQRFHKYGEDWVLKRIFRGDSQFPLFELTTASPLYQSSELGSVYEAKRNPAINVDKLIYFALSVFWRFDVWDGKYCSEYPVELGAKYRKLFRDYLLGDPGAFPRDISLIVALSKPESAKLAAYMPVGRRAPKDPRLHAYDFLVPGVRFHLSIGAALSSTARSLCIGNSAEGLIYVVDQIYGDAMANIAQTATKARRVGALRRS